MSERRSLHVITDAPQVLTGPTLTRYLREQGLSCRAAVTPGTLVNWGAIYLTDPDDLMRVCVLLEHHPQILDLAESRDRTDDGWPLWYRVARTTLPIMGTPTTGKP
jgi:hypothetical protein